MAKGAQKWADSWQEKSSRSSRCLEQVMGHQGRRFPLLYLAQSLRLPWSQRVKDNKVKAGLLTSVKGQDFSWPSQVQDKVQGFDVGLV